MRRALRKTVDYRATAAARASDLGQQPTMGAVARDAGRPRALPPGPGLGIDIDEDMLARYPAIPGPCYLPAAAASESENT